MNVTAVCGGPFWSEITTADAQGNFYSADRWRERIYRYHLGRPPSILAGDGYVGLRDGPAAQARFKSPADALLDRAGNLLILDYENAVIRKLTPDGQVSTLAGGSRIAAGAESADGLGSAASFSYLQAAAIDANDNMYIVEPYAIRRVTPSGVVSTLIRKGPNPSTGAGRFSPQGIAVTPEGRVVTYDSVQDAIVTIDGDGGTSVYLRIDRKNALLAGLSIVTRLACDRDGNLYLSALFTNAFGTMSCRLGAAGVTSLGAGYVFLDTERRPYLYSYSTLKRLNSGGEESVLFADAGLPGYRDGDASVAKFNGPLGLARDSNGDLFVADWGNNAVRRIARNGQVSTFAGGSNGFADGKGTAAKFNGPSALAFTAAGDLLVVDQGNYVIRRISPGGDVTTLAGTPGQSGNRLGSFATAQFKSPRSVTVDPAGTVYVVDGGNDRILQLANGQVTLLPTAEGWYAPLSVATSPGGDLYVADMWRIYAVPPPSSPGGTRTVRIVAGNPWLERARDGNGEEASFGLPGQIAFDARGYTYVADSYGYLLRRISPARDVLTVAGDGLNSVNEGRGWDGRPGSPYGLVHDGAGGVYFTDTLQHAIGHATWDLQANPRVLTEPTDQTVGVGADATFFVQYEAVFAPQLAWERRSAGSPTWQALADGTSFTRTKTSAMKVLAAGAIMDGDEFRCVITDEGKQVTSASAKLRVDSTPQSPAFYSQPISVAGVPNEPMFVTADAHPAAGYPTPTYQWFFNGTAIAGANSHIYSIDAMTPAQAGLYTLSAISGGVATSKPGIVGLWTDKKMVGDGIEIASDVVHPNGNVYDQVLMTGPAVAINADFRQVKRASFVDYNGDIVQVELSGAGTLTIVLAGAKTPATADRYNQPNVKYTQGHAGIIVTKSDETTNLSIFTVGRATAADQSLFRADATYDGVADLAFVAIYSLYSKFGALRTANVRYWAINGPTGIYAPKTQFYGPVYIGDISAQDDATPMLVVGSATEVRIAGGNLKQANNRPISIDGFSALRFSAGTDSHGRLLPAQSNAGRFERDGADVTNEISIAPAP